jgi:hypothetical protein
MPNACDDGICTPTQDGEGACLAGPYDGVCASATFNGCFSDADCAGFSTCDNDLTIACASAADCPAGGSCVPDVCVTRARGCFTDDGAIGGSVTTAASATTPVDGEWDATLASGFSCSRPSSAASVIGQPGLARLSVPLRVRALP